MMSHHDPEVKIPEVVQSRTPDEEEDVCRVCRSEGDHDNPLVYPCKCSGSVRYVHPDCLRSWLAHSQKRYCEICGHHYTFSKVYPDYIPPTIPISVYIRQGLLFLLRMLGHVFRVIFAICAWLIVLPAMNMASLRGLIWMADRLTLPATSNAPAATPSSNVTAVGTSLSNVSSADVIDQVATAGRNVSSWIHFAEVLDVFIHPVSHLIRWAVNFTERWSKGVDNTLPGFIFRGQILSITVAAVLIGFILLREWIQNHERGLLDAPPDNGPVVPGAHTPEDGEIDPDQWVFKDGVARERREVEIEAIIKRYNGFVKPQDQAKKRAEAEGKEFVEFRFELRPVAAWPPPNFYHTRQLLGQKTPTLAEAVALARDDAYEFFIADFDSTLGHERHEENMNSQTNEAEGSGGRAGNDGLVQNGESSSPNETTYPNPRLLAQTAQKSEISLSYVPPELLSETDGVGESSVADRKGKRKASVWDDDRPDYAYRVARHGFRVSKSELRDSRRRAAIAFDEIGDDVPGVSAENGLDYDPPPAQPPPDTRLPNDLQLEDHQVDRQFASLPRAPPSNLPTQSPNPNPVISTFQPEAGPSIPPHNHDTDGYLDARGTEEKPTPELSSEPASATAIVQIENPPARPPRLRRRMRVRRRDTEDEEDGDGDGEAEGDGEEENGEVDDDGEGFGERHGRLEDEEVEVMFRDGDEADEAWQRDEWDALLEAVGLIGPVLGLIQNVVLGTVLMGGAIALVVGVPMFIGKLCFSIDFVRSILYISRLLLAFIRGITDPVIDVALEILKDVIILPAVSSFKAAERILGERFFSRLVIANLTDTVPVDLGLEGAKSSLLSSFVRRMENIYGAVVEDDSVGDIFAFIGRHTFDGYEVYRKVCIQIASSSKISDRIWCLVAGYAVALGCAFGIALAGEANLGRLSTSVLSSIKQHALFFKLTFFMALELLVFPLGIGLVMNVVMLPLFPGASIQSYINLIRAYPFGGLFVCWLIGTLFMFSFAGLLSHIRTICRPGALFFIRDPADQNYSPVKDILERPAASQIRKLFISAVMYSVVVFWLFGASSWGMKYQPFPKVLPLRIGDFEPLSSVPFDLLFVHLVLPASLNSLRPRLRLKRVLRLWWKAVTGAFRLSSLIYGGNHEEEQMTPATRMESILWPVLDWIFQLVFGKYNNQSTNARVPTADQVVLLPPAERRNGGVFIPLDEEGKPKSKEDMIRMLKQDRLARNSHRDPKLDYTAVWLPRYWRTRIHVFIFSALITTGALIAIGFFGPLIIGRMAVGMLTDKPVHDGYSLLAGGYISWLGYCLGGLAKRRIILSNKARRLRRSSTSRLLKRTFLKCLKAVYALLGLYLVLPVFVGMVFELYVSVPARYGFLSDVTPVIHFWDVWAMGMSLDSIFVGMLGVLMRRRAQNDEVIRLRQTAPQELRDMLRDPIRQSFYRINTVLIPVLGYFLIPIFFPWFLSTLVLLSAAALNINELNPAITFRAFFPLSTGFVLLLTSRRIIFSTLLKIRQRLIDAEYVLEERVENYIPSPSTAEVVGSGEKVGDGEQVEILELELEEGEEDKLEKRINQWRGGVDKDDSGEWEDLEGDEA